MISHKILFTFSYLLIIVFCEDVCFKDDCQSSELQFRYLLYDINPSEGFNLRRDVYMRIAILANKMRDSKDPALNKFKLVLAPWSHLVHWSYRGFPEFIPWFKFFDIDSLKKFAPVMELHEYFQYLKENGYTKVLIDDVYILQHFDDMFETGNFEEKWKIEKCQKPTKLRYFHYSNFTSNNVKCLSFHGPTTKLIELFKKSKARTVLLEHAEVVLHDMFGGKIYWQARRSMRFNRELRKIAREFRRLYLNSTDLSDNTFLEADWRNDKPKRDAKGGPYIAVHIRRRDFLRGRGDEIPDLNSIATQLVEKLKELQLVKVFIATDASDKEYEELKSKLAPNYEVHKYIPSENVEKEYKEGGIAIIDQIICSYARYFIGTSESTFSFRIQEEREILGFPTEVTFNVLCKHKHVCEKPSIWKIVY